MKKRLSIHVLSIALFVMPPENATAAATAALPKDAGNAKEEPKAPNLSIQPPTTAPNQSNNAATTVLAKSSKGEDASKLVFAGISSKGIKAIEELFASSDEDEDERKEKAAKQESTAETLIDVDHDTEDKLCLPPATLATAEVPASNDK